MVTNGIEDELKVSDTMLKIELQPIWNMNKDEERRKTVLLKLKKLKVHSYRRMK